MSINWVLVSDTPDRPDLGGTLHSVPVGKTVQEVLDDMFPDVCGSASGQEESPFCEGAD